MKIFRVLILKKLIGASVRYCATRLFLTISCVAFCLPLLLGRANGQAIPEGRWIGACQRNGTYRHLIVYVDKESDGFNGFYLEPLRPERMMSEVRSISANANIVSFQLQEGDKSSTFSGEVNGHDLYGTLRDPQGLLNCHFLHVVKLQPVVLHDATGTYRISDHHDIVVNPEIRWLYFYDTQTHETRRLSPLSETEFVFGPTVGIHYPIQGRLNFEKDSSGKYRKLTIRRGGRVITATRVDRYTDREIEFKNEGVKLAGLLRLPFNGGPFPAVVLMQGSSPQPRWGQDGLEGFIADHLTRNGIAVLLVDKRGVGGSDGPTSDNLAVRAADTLAGIQFLRSLPEIDPKRIGLWGLSQGGMVEPYVAEKTPVSFVVNTSGDMINSNEQEIQRTELQLRADGFSELDIKDAVAFQKLKFHYACHRDNWEEYSAAVERFKNARWFPDPYVGPPTEKDSKSFDFWKCGDEPGVAWENYHGPALLVYGEFEGLSRTEDQIERFRAAMKKAGNSDYQIKIIKGVEHSMGVARGGGERERARVKGYAPEYFQIITNWMLNHFRLPTKIVVAKG